MQTVQKQALPVIIDANNEPVAVVYFSQDRKRIIYLLHEADEEDIISLLTLDGAGKTKIPTQNTIATKQTP